MTGEPIVNIEGMDEDRVVEILKVKSKDEYEDMWECEGGECRWEDKWEYEDEYDIKNRHNICGIDGSFVFGVGVEFVLDQG